ncbi:MAG: serine/threonine-protein phosphatase [Bacteroidales bacterium]|nr:serine/threonine-protein phosphatase [Bacteroidales bacterium]
MKLRLLIIIILVVCFISQSCFKGRSDENSEESSLEKMMYYTDKKIGKDEDTTVYIKKIDSLMSLLRENIKRGKIHEAFDNVKEANFWADTIGSAKQLARCYYYWGLVSARMNNVSISDKNYYSSLIYHKKMGDEKNISMVFRSWTRSSYENNIFDSARAYLHDYCINIDKSLGDKRGLKIDYIYLGEIALRLYRITPAKRDYNSLQTAYENFNIAKNIPVDLSETDCDELLKTGFCETYYYLAEENKDNPALHKAFTDSCRYDFDDAINIIAQSNDMEDYTRFFLMKIKMLIADGDIKTAQKLADSVNAVQDTAAFYHKETAMFAYSLIYEAQKNYSKALECKKQAEIFQKTNSYYRNSLISSLSLGRGQMENERNKAYAKKMELEGRTKSVMMISAIITTFIITILIIITYSRNRYKKANKIISSQKQEIEIKNANLIAKNEEIKSQNEEILLRNEEISKQSEIIKNYNHELTSSINYASRIQYAALPTNEVLSQLFGENLLIYSPKDIVSGDFYWCSQFANYKILAAGDCTGHGVPGALLSMLGISYLEYVTRNLDKKQLTASEILDRMKAILKNTLKQSDYESDNRDAIDMALIIVDTDTAQMQFAGANRPLIIIRNGEVLRTKGDSMPIGVFLAEKEHFTNNIIQLEKEDRIYLFSDGIPDQFGYREGRTEPEIFTMKRFLSLLTEIYFKPFDIQKIEIVKALKRWRKPKSLGFETCEQTDDNLLVGLSAENVLK